MKLVQTHSMPVAITKNGWWLGRRDRRPGRFRPL